MAMVIVEAALGQKPIKSSFQCFAGCNLFLWGTGTVASINAVYKIGFKIPQAPLESDADFTIHQRGPVQALDLVLNVW
jgi:hypothetical protein